MKQHCFAAIILLSAAPAAAAQDAPAAAGAPIVRGMCGGCHAFDTTTAGKMGPTLAGLMGRKAGAVEGYTYSDALKGLDVAWDEETLAAYLSDPRGYAPGTKKMVAVKNPEQLAAVIAYLKGMQP